MKAFMNNNVMCALKKKKKDLVINVSGLTFNLQAHLILHLAQNVTSNTSVGALVFWPGLFNLQSTVVVQLVLTTIQTTT